MQQYAIIIRADGTIPFDDDVSEEHKTAMLGHLTQMGHVIQRDLVSNEWVSLNHDKSDV